MEPQAERTSHDVDLASPITSSQSTQENTISFLSEPLGHEDIHGRDMQDRHIRDEGTGDQEQEPAKGKISGIHPPTFWCPFWLQRCVLGAFTCVFSGFVVASLVLSAYSRRIDGLAEARKGFSYLWRFGPTAILTAVSILWARVEFQAMRFTPWLALKDERPISSDIYALDYTQMLLPVALLQSIKRRHFQVFLISLTSVLLKVQIVLAPSIFKTAGVLGHETVQVQVNDHFLQTDNLANETYLAYYSARASHNFNLMGPFGLSSNFAYQTFSPARDQAQGSEPVLATLATVDALSLDIECRTLNAYNSTKRRSQLSDFMISFHFDTCSDPISVKVPPTTISRRSSSPTDEKLLHSALEEFGDSKPPCPSLPHKHPQFIYYAAYLGGPAMNLVACSAVLCAPRASLLKAFVSNNGVDHAVSLLANHEHPPRDAEINPWILLTKAIPPGLGSWAGGRLDGSKRYAETWGQLWGPAHAYAEFRDQENRDPELLFNQTDMLYASITNLTNFIGPHIAHHRLRQERESTVEGSRMTQVERLRVNRGVSVAMTALSAVSALVSMWAMLLSTQLSRTWLRDPSTILGVMAFSRSNYSADSLSLRKDHLVKLAWISRTHTPLILRTWVRSAYTAYTVLLIIGMTVSLKVSKDEIGLVTLAQNDNLFPIWKSIPTFLLIFVAFYCTSLDVAIRSLAVHHKLSIQSCPASELDTSFPDMLGLRAMWHAFRAGIPAIMLTQVIVILCSFLASISSILFSSMAVPGVHSITLRQHSWFGTANGTKNLAPLRSLFIVRDNPNISYPDNTYDDLVFPTVSTSLVGHMVGDALRAKMPAARIGHTCEELSEGIDFNATVETRPDGAELKLAIDIPITRKNGSLFTHPDRWYIPRSQLRDGTGYIGTVLTDLRMYYADEFKNTTNSSHTFAWGSASSTTEEFDHLSVWRCHYWWTAVETEAHFVNIGREFQVNPSIPPITNESTIQMWDPPFHISYPFGSTSMGTSDPGPFPDVLNPNSELDQSQKLFQILTEPIGSVKLDDLGQASKAAYVLEEINRALRFSWAQIANIENRLSVDEKSMAYPFEPPELPPIDATVVDNQRYRLVQDPIATSFILAILSVVVMVNTWALVSQWLRGRVTKNHEGRRWLRDLSSRDLAPENFNSVEMMESLLHDSNCHKYTPDNAIHIPSNQLYKAMGKKFRMGWFFDGRKQETVYTIGALGDVDFEFTGPNKDSTRSYDRSESPIEEEVQKAQGRI